MTLITTFCSWCNNIIHRKGNLWKYHNTKHSACSPECQKKLSSLLQSDDWTKLNDRQKKAVMRVGYKKYAEDLELYRHTQMTEYLKAHNRKQLAKVKKIVPKNPEIMLLAHYEALQDDPEAMSSKFIDNIMGWNQDEVDKKNNSPS